jgi:hypothetical protein
MEMRDAILLDQLKKALRVEAWLENGERAFLHGTEAVKIWRRVIDRTGNNRSDWSTRNKSHHLV